MSTTTPYRSTSRTAQPPKESKLDPEQRVQLPLVKINFILMGVAAALIVVGFLLMLGGSTTAEGFNPDIFSTRRIVVGPALSFIGFVFMGFAIIYRSKKVTGHGLD